ncbi:amidase domain-containing protein [Streptomyces sp. NPDC059688]|uniref:amidase domain-containing protein n=1 Tax=Streptomyces sp. NPDC059688 TaxID=3346906 RepID=UPI00368F89F4
MDHSQATPGRAHSDHPTGAGAVKPAATAAYSYHQMIAYADKYWDHHNSAYRTYGGNDCTNFLSQIMLAGGWKPAGGSIIQRTSNKYSKRTKSVRNVYDLLASDVLQAGAFPTSPTTPPTLTTKA